GTGLDPFVRLNDPFGSRLKPPFDHHPLRRTVRARKNKEAGGSGGGGGERNRSVLFEAPPRALKDPKKAQSRGVGVQFQGIAGKCPPDRRRPSASEFDSSLPRRGVFELYSL